MTNLQEEEKHGTKDTTWLYRFVRKMGSRMGPLGLRGGA